MRTDRTHEVSAALSDADGTKVGVLEAEFTTGSIPDRFVPDNSESDPSRSSPRKERSCARGICWT
jgi:hypothetical protein